MCARWSRICAACLRSGTRYRIRALRLRTTATSTASGPRGAGVRVVDEPARPRRAMTSTRAGRTAAAAGALVFGVALAACGGRGRADAEAGRPVDSTDRDPARIARVERGLLPTVALRGRRDTAY